MLSISERSPVPRNRAAFSISIKASTNKTDGLFSFNVVWLLFFLRVGGSPASDEVHTKKGHGAAANKLPSVPSGFLFEIPVQNSTPEDDGQREHDELSRDD